MSRSCRWENARARLRRSNNLKHDEGNVSLVFVNLVKWHMLVIFEKSIIHYPLSISGIAPNAFSPIVRVSFCYLCDFEYDPSFSHPRTSDSNKEKDNARPLKLLQAWLRIALMRAMPFT